MGGNQRQRKGQDELQCSGKSKRQRVHDRRGEKIEGDGKKGGVKDERNRG